MDGFDLIVNDDYLENYTKYLEGLRGAGSIQLTDDTLGEKILQRIKIQVMDILILKRKVR